MFPLNSLLNTTSLKIWLQTNQYVRINQLPDLSNENYFHITKDNKHEPFLLDQSSFKMGSLVLVKKPNANLWDVYKLTIQGNILKYENLLIDTYWNSFKNSLSYTTDFIENFINNSNKIFKLPIDKQVKLFGDFNAAVDRTVDPVKRKTYLTHLNSLIQMLLINLYKDAINNPDSLKTTTHVFSAKSLLIQLNNCPWLSADDAKDICLALEANNGVFKTHVNILNVHPSIGQHLFGKINDKVYILSKNYLYLYNEKNDKKMRLFSLR